MPTLAESMVVVKLDITWYITMVNRGWAQVGGWAQGGGGRAQVGGWAQVRGRGPGQGEGASHGVCAGQEPAKQMGPTVCIICDDFK